MNMFKIKSSSVSPAALAAILGSGNAHELLDVRTPSEYASAHVPGARLIPLNELKVEAILAEHKPGTPIYVLCQAGARATKAIEQFERAGCDDCVLVEGGTQAWIDVGLPVHHGVRSVLPLMRQVQIVVGAFSVAGTVLALIVNRWFAVLPLFLGCGLLFAGITGTCGMALLLARMPWNRGQESSCDCCTSE
jgi:rhodanese-related sulfurtransferase